jgi:hypothetical protein
MITKERLQHAHCLLPRSVVLKNADQREERHSENRYMNTCAFTLSGPYLDTDITLSV